MPAWTSSRCCSDLGDELGLNGSKGSDRTMSKAKTRADKQLAKARTRDSMQALEKLTEVVDGETRFVSDPPLIVPIEELLPEDESDAADRTYARPARTATATPCRATGDTCSSQFRFVSIARKVVGVGSVGTRAWVLLLVGSDGTDPLLLQAKEAQESVSGTSSSARATMPTRGSAVVAGQHLMQASSDIFLGWDRVEGIDGVQRDFYIRQLRGLEGLGRHRGHGPPGHGHLRSAVRLDVGPGARPIGRPDRHRLVPRVRARLSTTPSFLSPSPMPTRTSATTTRSKGGGRGADRGARPDCDSGSRDPKTRRAIAGRGASASWSNRSPLTWANHPRRVRISSDSAAYPERKRKMRKIK